MSLRKDIVDIARGQKGYNVQAKKWSKYTTDLNPSYKYRNPVGDEAEWCGDFVLWCVDMLDGKINNYDKIRNALMPSNLSSRLVDNIKKYNNDTIYAKFHPMVKNNFYTPKPGDLALFDDSDGGLFDHIGIVTEVDQVKKEFKYVDGNNTYPYGRNVREGSPKPYESANLVTNTKNGSTITQIYMGNSKYTCPAGFISIDYEKLEGSGNTLTYPRDTLESNDTFTSAKPLSNKSGNTSTLAYDGKLTLHNSQDKDYFKFNLSTRGQAHNEIVIDDAAFRNKRITLYDSKQKQVTQYTTKNGKVHLSLAYKPADTYYVCIDSLNGGAGGYKLQWNVAAKDRFDSTKSNDTMNSATSAEASTGSFSGLNLHNSSDKDYFRIKLNSTGTSDNFAWVRGTCGEKLEILTPYNSVVKSGKGRVSLSGLAAGTYYARISTTELGSNDYSFSWNTVSPVSSQREIESNNTRYWADTLRGTTGTMKGSIGTTTDVDWFRFTLGSRGTTNNKIELTSGSNSQRLVLYDANEKKLTGSYLRSLSLSGKAAGTYYVKVYDSVGFRSGDYTLAWNTSSSSRAATSVSSRAATPTTQSLTSSSDVMYNSAAGAFASYLNSAGAAAHTVSQSSSDSLRKYGTLVQA